MSASSCPFRQYLVAQPTRQKYRTHCLYSSSSYILNCLAFVTTTWLWISQLLVFRRWCRNISYSQFRQSFLTSRVSRCQTGNMRRCFWAAETSLWRKRSEQKEQELEAETSRSLYYLLRWSADLWTVTTSMVDLAARRLIVKEYFCSTMIQFAGSNKLVSKRQLSDQYHTNRYPRVLRWMLQWFVGTTNLLVKGLLIRVFYTSLSKTMQEEPAQRVGDDKQRVSPIKALFSVISASVAKHTGHRVSHDELQTSFELLVHALRWEPDNPSHIKRWAGELIRTAAGTAQAFKGRDDIRMSFAQVVLGQYRKFILEIPKIAGMNIKQMEQIFDDSSRKTIEFLQYQYPLVKRRAGNIILSQKIDSTSPIVDPKYSLLWRSCLGLNLNNKETLRMDIKKMINVLISHSHQKFPHFKATILKTFSQANVIDDKKFYSSISHRIQTGRLYKSEELASPGFTIYSQQITDILMEWIQQIRQNFKDPSGFCENVRRFNRNQIQRLGQIQRRRLQKHFAVHSDQVQKDIDQVEIHLRRVISSIIMISQSQIKSHKNKQKDKQNIHFLNKDEISMTIVCEYLSKALNDYIIDILCRLLMRTSQAWKELDESPEEKEIDQRSIVTLGNLFRCECSGTKEHITAVYNALVQSDDITIVKVRNSLNEDDNQIVINFVFNDPNQCLFICEIKMFVSASQEVDNIFPKFIAQQARSSHGVIASLGMIYHYLDTRKHYSTKHLLTFEHQIVKFKVERGRTFCSSCDRQTQMVKQNNQSSYVCSSCCKFVQAYHYYFCPKKCPVCLLYLCPICEIRDIKRRVDSSPLCLQKTGSQILASDILGKVPSLKKYQFLLKKLFLPYQAQQIRHFVGQMVKESSPYMLLVSFANDMNKFRIDIIKSIAIEQKSVTDKSARSVIVSSFTNEEFDLAGLGLSFVLILIPQPSMVRKIRSEQYSKFKAKKYERIVNLQGRFKPECHQYLYSLSQGPDSNEKELLLDYCIDSEQEMKELVSDNNVRNLVITINESLGKNERLKLSNISINFAPLNDILHKQKVTDIEISNGVRHSKHDIRLQYQVLGQLTKVRFLFLENTEVEEVVEMEENEETQPTLEWIRNNTLTYQMKFQHLEEIYIHSCKLRAFNFQLYPNAKTIDLKKNLLNRRFPVLDLPKLQYLDLSDNQIRSLQNLPLCYLPEIDHINLQHNYISGEFPILNYQQQVHSDLTKHNSHCRSFQKLRLLNINGDNYLDSIKNLRLCKLPKLKYLLLQNNAIRGKLPSLSQQNLPQLEYLRLSGNQIDGLEPQSHSQLVSLDLHQNLISHVPKLDLPRLKELNLICNRIESLESLQDLISNLHTSILYLGDNPFPVLPLVPTNIGMIKIEKCKVIFPVQNLWEDDQRSDFRCDICMKIISTPGMYSDGNKRDFHKECYSSLAVIPQEGSDTELRNGCIQECIKSAVLFVGIKGEDINRNI